jgi:hypothetical protein
MKSKVRMRTAHREQRGDPPPSQEFHLQFLHLHYLGCYFYYSSVNLRARIKSYKTCDLMIPSFKKKKAVLNFTHFLDTLKLGMKQGLQGQTQAQRHEVKNDKNSPSEMDI